MRHVVSRPNPILITITASAWYSDVQIMYWQAACRVGNALTHEVEPKIDWAMTPSGFSNSAGAAPPRRKENVYRGKGAIRMLQRVRSLLIISSFRILSRTFSRDISIPYRKMAGIPSTYNSALASKPAPA